MPTATEEVLAARRQILYTEPYFANGLFKLEYEECPDIKTFDVDGKTIRYNPEFVKTLSMSLKKSVLAHELLHVLLCHHTRRNDRDADTWNQAGDFVINAILKDSGFELGDGWLYDPKFSGMSADQVYNKIYQPKPQQPQSGGQQQPQGGGNQPPPPAPGQPGANGKPSPQGNPSTAPGQVRDAPVPQEEIGTEEAEWKQVAVQSALAAEKAGHMPGGLRRMVDSIIAPKLDWRAILRQFVAQTIKTDFSWSRPNKRFVGLGMYLPAPVKSGCPHFAFGFDLSGSVTQAQANQASAEVSCVQEELHPEKITVIPFDTKVSNVQEFFPGDEVKLSGAAGGGTDFRCVFDYIAEMEDKPAALIILTDCDGTFPKEAPDYPVLWISTGSCDVPFGDIVQMKD